jgi:carbamoyltransferase
VKLTGWGGQLPRLRDRLVEAGFDGAWLRERLGVALPDDVGLLNRAAAIERLHEDRSAAAVLARLFYLETVETRASVRRVLGRGEDAALARVGLIGNRAGRRVARLRLDAFAGLYLLADRRMERVDPRALGLPAGDAVYPVGSDSAILAGAVPARDGERVLDLCSGTGVQGLKAAATAREVIAVDVGARAVALAEANARLNGVARFAARRGDLFRPVAGERFDLILVNPPFVSSPHRGPAYHSGGALGDRVLKRAAAGFSRHLRDGGRAFAISHLALRRNESVEERVRSWRLDFPGRILLLLLEGGSIVDLAAAQALFALDRGLAAYGREIGRWLAYLRRFRIDSIALVLLAAERGPTTRLDVVEGFQRTLPLPLSPPPAEHVKSWLAS